MVSLFVECWEIESIINPEFFILSYSNNNRFTNLFSYG